MSHRRHTFVAACLALVLASVGLDGILWTMEHGHGTPEASGFQLPAYVPNSQKVHKSPNDPSDYLALRLPNGLEVLLVHNAKADRAAASMTVDVGSADDPLDIPGLAHFNEHMLFLGTDRYPSSTDYQDFVRNHGGAFNAGTSSQTTTYFFDIPPADFHGALTRFARFFVAPLFNADYVDRERHAVDSEYHMGLQDDGRRSTEALLQAFNPEHPFTRFNIGSLDTLKDGKLPLRQRLLDFYQRHYDANLMHLVLLGPEPVDQLEALARSLFQDVPNRHLSFHEIDTPLIAQGQLPAQMEINSLQEGHSLTFYFPVSVSRQYPSSRPDAYLAGLIGDKGRGSILAALRKAGWAYALSATSGWDDRRHGLFSVQVDLTAEGVRHQEQIQATLFAYIDRLKNTGQQKWRHDEQALLLAQYYPFLQVGSGAARASQFSAALSTLPPSEVNVAPFRMQGFDPAVIQNYLKQLTADNLLRVYIGPKVRGEQRSRWYHTPYSLRKVTAWPAAKPLTGLSLPDKNRFIATDFSIKKVSDPKPRCLIREPGLDLWYQGNDSFGTPAVQWHIQLLGPNADGGLRHSMLNVLLAFWLVEQNSEALYPAILAGQRVTLAGQAQGIELSLAGWRDKQPEFLATLLQQLRTAPIEPTEFARVSKLLDQWLVNRHHQALAGGLSHLVQEYLVRPNFVLAQGQDELRHISLDDLRAYRSEWLRSLHVQALAVGNLSEEDARRGGEVLSRQLAPRVALEKIPKLEALQVAPNMPILRPDSDNSDSEAFSLRVAPDAGLKTTAAWAVLARLINAPFYSQLRSREQLGYMVDANYYRVVRAPALYALIQSPNHGSDALFERMDKFFQDFTAQIDRLDAQNLAGYQGSITHSLLERPQSLAALADLQSWHLTLDLPGFDYNERLAKEVGQLKPADIQAAWKTLLAQPPFKVAHDKDVAPNEKTYSASRSLSPVPD